MYSLNVALTEPIELPLCDVCGNTWFPREKAARKDPRAYDAAQRALGAKGKPLRCGMCKSPNWDRDWLKEQKAAPVSTPDDDLSDDQLRIRYAVKAVVVPGRCKHLLLDCPICHHTEDA